MVEHGLERTIVVGRHVMVGVSRVGDRDVWETYDRGRVRLAEAARERHADALGIAIAGLTGQELQLTALLSR
ncbi:MAG TPA: hypothetical protein VKP64_14065 [Mycobacteriales bacterium]|nr:hypothetical protein [Mycobacteriales bacterium]